MDTRIRRFVWQTPLLIVAILIIGVFAPGGPVHAAPMASGPRPQVITETIQLSAAQCARIRKAFPTASCTILHTTEVTDSTPRQTSGNVVPLACATGDLYFTDTYTNLPPVLYQLQIITQFHWSGNCGQPIGQNGPQCQVNFAFVTIGNEQCYYWYSNEFNATEGKYTVFVGALGIGYTAGVYRGCGPDKTCYGGWV